MVIALPSKYLERVNYFFFIPGCRSSPRSPCFHEQLILECLADNRHTVLENEFLLGELLETGRLSAGVEYIGKLLHDGFRQTLRPGKHQAGIGHVRLHAEFLCHLFQGRDVGKRLERCSPCSTAKPSAFPPAPGRCRIRSRSLPPSDDHPGVQRSPWARRQRGHG